MRRIRAVLDTNIIVSGLISSSGSPRKILEMARSGVFQAVTSVSINREILDALHRPYIYAKYHLSEEIIDGVSAFLYEGAVLTEDTIIISRIKKDPADNKFIACAIEGDADYIVSGDEHLLSLKHHKNIQICDAGVFLKLLGKISK